MNKIFVASACVIALFSGGCMSSSNIEYSKEDRLVTQIEAKLAQHLAAKYGLRVVGDSTSMPGGVIKEVGLLFQVNHLLTREEARELLVNCVQEFLSEMNSNEEIRPHLENYPFTSKNIDITVFIKDQKGKDVFDPNLGVVHARFGKLDYATYKKENEFYQHQSDYEETFEEAEKLVNQTYLQK